MSGSYLEEQEHNAPRAKISMLMSTTLKTKGAEEDCRKAGVEGGDFNRYTTCDDDQNIHTFQLPPFNRTIWFCRWSLFTLTRLFLTYRWLHILLKCKLAYFLCLNCYLRRKRMTRQLPPLEAGQCEQNCLIEPTLLQYKWQYQSSFYLKIQ